MCVNFFIKFLNSNFGSIFEKKITDEFRTKRVVESVFKR